MFEETTKQLTEALANKKIRRQAKHRLAADVRATLETSAFSRGVPGWCAGARPAQIKAAVKQIVQNESSAAIRLLRKQV